MADSINWNDTTPLRLRAAIEKAFPQGGMTVSGLRREAHRGRLAVEQIAGKDFTSLKAIAEMRKLCLIKPKAITPVVTERANEEQAGALAKLARLRRSPPPRG